MNKISDLLPAWVYFLIMAAFLAAALAISVSIEQRATGSAGEEVYLTSSQQSCYDAALLQSRAKSTEPT
ncbi:hypothetical protein [Phyllobacterium sp. SB3]|uniref:hypothetical protein n=1 Tax=Phyllobacterium sp. SB3 TaxID=3156073 RepID=UPI0032B01C37